MIPLPPNVADLRGQTFGHLTVRAFDGQRNGYSYWSCDCECGKTGYIVRGKNLVAWDKAGRAISCGCYRASALVRRAARLTMDERARKTAASGIAVTPPKPPAKPRPPREKRLLPFLEDRTEKARAEKACAPEKVVLTVEPVPVAIAAMEPARTDQPITTPPTAATPHTIWAVIVKDGHGGYHVGIRLHKTATHAILRSRRLGNPSEARREARRIFGDALAWTPGAQSGLHTQPWVVEIAEIHVS